MLRTQEEMTTNTPDTGECALFGRGCKNIESSSMSTELCHICYIAQPLALKTLLSENPGLERFFITKNAKDEDHVRAAGNALQTNTGCSESSTRGSTARCMLTRRCTIASGPHSTMCSVIIVVGRTGTGLVFSTRKQSVLITVQRCPGKGDAEEVRD
jgi:hypothetical protein